LPPLGQNLTGPLRSISSISIHYAGFFNAGLFPGPPSTRLRLDPRAGTSHLPSLLLRGLCQTWRTRTTYDADAGYLPQHSTHTTNCSGVTFDGEAFRLHVAGSTTLDLLTSGGISDYGETEYAFNAIWMSVLRWHCGEELWDRDGHSTRGCSAALAAT
jgi:hypothetical protein